jgi:hypothetical protein
VLESLKIELSAMVEECDAMLKHYRDLNAALGKYSKDLKAMEDSCNKGKNWASGIGLVCVAVIGLTAGHFIFAAAYTAGVIASACAGTAAATTYVGCCFAIEKNKRKQAEA